MKPQGTDTLFTAIAGGLASTVAYLVGGVDSLSTAFGIFIVLDFVTGVLSAYYLDNVDSYVAYKGLAKKAGMIAFVVIANQLDIVTGNSSGFLRDAMIMCLIGMEGISIKENCQKMGITAPAFLTDTLNKLIHKDDNNKPKGE